MYAKEDYFSVERQSYILSRASPIEELLGIVELWRGHTFHSGITLIYHIIQFFVMSLEIGDTFSGILVILGFGILLVMKKSLSSHDATLMLRH